MKVSQKSIFLCSSELGCTNSDNGMRTKGGKLELK